MGSSSVKSAEAPVYLTGLPGDDDCLVTIQPIDIPYLRNQDLGEVPYIAYPYLPVGLSLYVGRPGGGKSTNWQQLAHAVAFSVPFPGIPADHIAHTRVLFIDFEAGMRTTRSASLRVAKKGTLPTDGMDLEPDDNGPYIYFDAWPGDTFERRLDCLRRYLTRARDAGDPFGLIGIDTYTFFIGAPPLGVRQDMWEGECLTQLNALMRDFNCAGMAIAHPNKGGAVSGSTRISGAVTQVVKIERAARETEAVILCEKNRLGAEWQVAADFSGGTWTILEGQTPDQARRSGTPFELLTALTSGPMTVADLRMKVGASKNTVKVALRQLKRANAIQQDDEGYYSPVRQPGLNITAEQPPTMWQPWGNCQACKSIVDPLYGCVNVRCEHYDPVAWGYQPEPQPPEPTELTSDMPEEVLDTGPPPRPVPKYRTMTKRDRTVEAPPIDARHKGKNKDGSYKWAVSPITTATDLIMQARDEGRLKPKWRIPLPDGIELTDAAHQWGSIPRWDTITGPYTSYDVNGSFLSGYKTRMCVQGIPTEPYKGEWDAKMAGVVKLTTPAWEHAFLGHPLGEHAVPGAAQWWANRSVEMVMDLAADGMIERPEILEMRLIHGPKQDSENLLEKFRKQMIAARAVYQDIELQYIKEMYSKWLSSAVYGRYNIFQRPDIAHAVRAESFLRLWLNGYEAHKAGVEVIGMGNTDELVVRPHAALETLFPGSDLRVGKLKVKGRSDDAA